MGARVKRPAFCLARHGISLPKGLPQFEQSSRPSLRTPFSRAGVLKLILGVSVVDHIKSIFVLVTRNAIRLTLHSFSYSSVGFPPFLLMATAAASTERDTGRAGVGEYLRTSMAPWMTSIPRGLRSRNERV